ncbi:helix-turn-helix transcriptional regulator [Thalassococcus sp. S3]|uniref:helix-turn-helix transcriptional regulator n=1 Tax=Thalassococcus sp. S3 TaxID=2017482 RepID=UPI0010244D61|nr:helix-turn-helix transcriptional regulator [Thalassococcus sp. S3]QBF32565.1 transcriptional regulator [Thalassococcus sp. S3]
MARDTLTGSRIRERRSIAGLRQADLARRVGISASYLNLIEHNRRRIGGKLLVDIAGVLGVEPSMLSEGAEAALIATLREAAADAGTPVAEMDRADEFAGRFPGWAEVLARAHRRIATLERTVETLSDRLTHDPHLAASLHEVLSTATAIRSTASILAETGEIEPQWRDRFHRNLNEDSRRLAESSKALVGYLDESGEDAGRGVAPQEEVEAFVAARDHHFADLERGEIKADKIVTEAQDLTGKAARQIAKGVLAQYESDAKAMPLEEVAGALGRHGLDPVALADAFGVDLPCVFRRLASLPDALVGQTLGLVVCDASGSLIFRKQIEGFALPRFGASCPLWPVFTALSRPGQPLRRRVVQMGRSSAVFECFAIARDVGRPSFERDPQVQSTMLIVPVREAAEEDQPPLSVGSSCRICPAARCAARREPSILREEF